jgi:PAS domain S-box-containing protein
VRLLVVEDEATGKAHPSEAILTDLRLIESAVVLVTSRGAIVEASPAAARTFGMSEAELRGKTLLSLSHPVQPDGRTAEAALGALEHSGAPGPWTARGAHGGIVHLEAAVREVRIAGLEDARLVTARDVTRERTLEVQLQKAQRLEALGLVAGGIAHDFNNMLTAIVGFVELALNQGTGVAGTARHHIQEARRAADRACDVARQLLAIGKQRPTERRPIHVDEHVRRCEPLLQRLVREDVKIQLDLTVPGARVMGDAAQLEQVLLNLVANARDAMPRGGTLSIATSEREVSDAEADLLEVAPGPHLVMRVSDTGTGMSDAVKARIFDPFFTTKTPEKGTGLGLSIVHAAVKQHEGSIHVDSTPGQGTTVTIHLPLADGAEARTRTPGPLRRGTETVLVVEDDPSVREVLVAMLETLGHRTLACADAHEAVMAFTKNRDEVAIVVTDVVMPDENGIDLERRLRALEPRIKVVLVSGYSGDQPLSEGTIWLEKPIGIHALSNAFRTLLG